MVYLAYFIGARRHDIMYLEWTQYLIQLEIANIKEIVDITTIYKDNN